MAQIIKGSQRDHSSMSSLKEILCLYVEKLNYHVDDDDIDLCGLYRAVESHKEEFPLVKDCNEYLYEDTESLRKFLLENTILQTFDKIVPCIFYCRKCSLLKRHAEWSAKCSCNTDYKTFCPNCGGFFEGSPKEHLTRCDFAFLKRPSMTLFQYRCHNDTCFVFYLNPKKTLSFMEFRLKFGFKPLDSSFVSTATVGDTFYEEIFFFNAMKMNVIKKEILE